MKKPVDKDERTILIELKAIKTAVIVTGCLMLVGSIIIVSNSRSYKDIIWPGIIFMIFFLVYYSITAKNRPEIVPTVLFIQLDGLILPKRLVLYLIEAIIACFILSALEYFLFRIIKIFKDYIVTGEIWSIAEIVYPTAIFFIINLILNERSLVKYQKYLITEKENSQ